MQLERHSRQRLFDGDIFLLVVKLHCDVSYRMLCNNMSNLLYFMVCCGGYYSIGFMFIVHIVWFNRKWVYIPMNILYIYSVEDYEDRSSYRHVS